MNAVWWFDDDEPEPDVWHLFTDIEAERVLRIPAATIRSWRRRKKIQPKGIDEHGRVMFERGDLLALARRRQP